MSDIRLKIKLLVVLLVVSAGVSALSTTHWMMVPTPGTDVISMQTEKTVIPPYSTSTREKLEQSHGFQIFISYLDSGFEPNEITIKVGDTIRFTNNSSRGVWVAASGSKLYPSVPNECGSSALDSCEPISAQDFWEFTFTKSGNWVATNNLDKSKTILVHVR